jgi:two-component system, chemotaxis family, chemotaxis protein CheY
MTTAASTPLHHHAVLVVEDSDIGRESLALLLQMEGYRTVTAPTGLEALHLLHTLRLRPCVVVADLIMPKMDGFTFRSEQLKHPDLASIPVIALTGHEGLRRHAIDNGFAAGLLKPCDFDELFRLIDRHCGRRATLHVAKRA